MLKDLLQGLVSNLDWATVLHVVSFLVASFLFVIAIIDQFEKKHSVSPPQGYKRLGRTGPSNLADEDDAKYSIGKEPGADDKGSPNWKVKALYIFPIKSCAAVELDEADICAAGLVWDREFSFAEFITPETRPDATEEEKRPIWRFRTQRAPGYENLALIKPELWFPANQKSTAPAESVGGVMIVRYPHVYNGPLASIYSSLQKWNLLPPERSFSIPLDPPKKGEYESKDVVIWKDTPSWFDYSRYLPHDVAKFVKAECPFALFRANPERYRHVMRCAPRENELGYQSVVGFQDAYPLHLLNLGSVRDVAEKVEYALPFFSARRFRANFITSGPKAYDEDDWKRIRIGEEEYYCACHTVRCKLPNVCPDTAVRDRFEPDRALKKFRRIDAGDPTNACLGLQLVPARAEGKIKVGDEIVVLQRGPHLYIKQ